MRGGAFLRDALQKQLEAIQAKVEGREGAGMR